MSEGPLLTIDERPSSDGATVLAVAGEIDVATAPALDERLASLGGSGPVVLDFAGVTFMDSTGVNTLAKAVAQGVELVLRDLTPQVRRLVELTHLDKIVRVEP